MAFVSGKKVIPLLGVAALGFFGLALFISSDLGGAARSNRAKFADGEADPREDLKIEGFRVTPMASDGRRLVVEGTVTNTGDKLLDAGSIMIEALDGEGHPIAAIKRRVLDQPLSRGETQSFRFEIEGRPEFERFQYRVP